MTLRLFMVMQSLRPFLPNADVNRRAATSLRATQMAEMKTTEGRAPTHLMHVRGFSAVSVVCVRWNTGDVLGSFLS